jgi:hypothetical protein
MVGIDFDRPKAPEPFTKETSIGAAGIVVATCKELGPNTPILKALIRFRDKLESGKKGQK